MYPLCYKKIEIKDKTYNKINRQTVVTVFVDLCGVAVYGQVRSTMCVIGSVGATGERDRSRTRVKFKIKCFNISKIQTTELNSTGFQTMRQKGGGHRSLTGQ